MSGSLLGWLLGALTIAVIPLVTGWDNVELFVGRIQGLFARFSSRADKEAVRLTVQATVSKAASELQNTMPGLLPSKVRIQWVTAEKAQSYLGEGDEVIVLMGYQKGRGRNVAVALHEVVSKGLLSGSRQYVSPLVLRPSISLVSHKLLQFDEVAARYFVAEILEQQLEDPSFREWYGKLVTIDRRGMFVHVFLRELYELGVRLGGSPPDETTRRDTCRLAQFLYAIASKAKDEDVPLLHTTRTFRIAIVLVAREDVVLKYGVDPHLQRARDNLKRGVDVV